MDGAKTILDDFGGDLADATEANGAGCAGREVEHPAADKRPSIVDGHNDAAAAMGHPQLGAEWQRAMGAGHGVLIEPLARGGLAAGLIAIIGRNAREAVSGARHRRHRGIGVPPRRGRRGAGMAGVVVVERVVVVMSGFGRSLGGSPTDKQSCGKNS